MASGTRSVVTILLALLAAGCGTIRWELPPGTEGTAPDRSYGQSPNPSASVYPAQAAALAAAAAYAIHHHVGPATNLRLAAAAAALAYVVYDPLAPNWAIEERILDRETYVLSLRAKGFRIGGDGESALIVRRRAAQLQRERGSAGFRIVDFVEGIESSTPVTRRYAEGVIQLIGLR